MREQATEVGQSVKSEILAKLVVSPFKYGKPNTAFDEISSCLSEVLC